MSYLKATGIAAGCGAMLSGSTVAFGLTASTQPVLWIGTTLSMVALLIGVSLSSSASWSKPAAACVAAVVFG